MPTFENIVIRCALFPDDVSPNNNFISEVTSREPAMYAGAQVEFQFGIFKKKAVGADPAVMDSIANFGGLPKMRIRTTNAAGAVLLDETVVGAVVSKDETCDIDTWVDGTKQHFRFYFPETTTVIAAGEQYIVVFGPDGDVFGRSKITVIDPGTGAGSSPAPIADGYFTKTEMNGKLADKMDKQLTPGQSLSFLTEDSLFRITLQPVNDAEGARLVTIVEPLA